MGKKFVKSGLCNRTIERANKSEAFMHYAKPQVLPGGEMSPDAAWLGRRGQVSMEFIITIIMVLMIFLFGVFLFQNRTDFNYQVSQSWEARDMANKIARNINNVYLMDNNSVLVDYVFWSGADRMVEVGDRTIRVYYGSNFADSPFFAELEWNVTDVNGYILFKKINNKLVVDYE